MFRAGRAISIARRKVKSEKWGEWGRWLEEHYIKGTAAWEAATLYERAGSEDAIANLTRRGPRVLLCRTGSPKLLGQLLDTLDRDTSALSGPAGPAPAEFRTKLELAAELLRWTVERSGKKCPPIRVVTDGEIAYTGLTLPRSTLRSATR